MRDGQGKRGQTGRGVGLSRRRFLAAVGGGAAALGAAACLPHVSGEWGTCDEPDGGGADGAQDGSEGGPPAPLSNRVVEIATPGLVDPDTLVIDPTRLPELLSAGLLALTGAASLAEAWQIALPGRQAGERVGLKANTLNARVPTSPAVLAALVGSLRVGAGLQEDEVFVWDRSLHELTRAGYDPAALGCGLVGTQASSTDPSGPGYLRESVCLSGRQVYLTRVLTEGLEHLINVAVMKNHLAAGFSGALKNHYGSFSRPGDFHEGCEQHIARLNALPAIATKSRLHVLDALVGICAGDTADPPDCAPGRVLLAFDPVALDRRGVEVRDEARAARGAPPGAPAAYLDLAAELGLGSLEYDLVRIT
jgi:uncharacterized protein (DUF362 family)